jgi:hypothetical protein
MSSNPTTIVGRNIAEAYFYCLNSGMTLTICIAACFYTFHYRGVRRDSATILQYSTHFFGIVQTGISYYNLTDPRGCPPIIATSIAFTLCDVAVDTYIFAIVLAMIPNQMGQNYKRYFYWILYFICEFGTRILNYAFITFQTIGFLCRPQPQVEVSFATTMVKSAFVGLMGVDMIFQLIRYKNQVIQAVGLKTLIASVFLVIAKLALFLPYTYAPFGIFSVTLLNFQQSVQSIILVFFMVWNPTFSEETFAITSSFARQTNMNTPPNSGVSSIQKGK